MSEIAKQIIALKSKDIKELRAMHKSLFGESPPKHHTRHTLYPKLAYRIQELALGGLDDTTKQKLEKISKGVNIPKDSQLLPGVKLQREYDSIIHEVEVKKDGYEYKGQSFKSLSAIARKITGTRWNGPKFFKVR